MSRHPNEPRSSSPAVRRARERSGATVAARVTADATAPGGVRVDLAVRVEDIPDTGITVDETLPETFISALLDDGHEIRWSGHGPTALHLHLSHEAGFVRVKGDVHFALAHPCVRCLQTVPFEADLAVDVRMLERNSAPVVEAAEAPAKPKRGAQDHGWPDDDDGPLGDPTELEDLNVASYEHGTVRLDELIREQVFLELPMHPACDMPSARPTQPCAYRPVPHAPPDPKPAVDPRWAGLAALRDRLPPASDVVPTSKGRTRRTEATATATLPEVPFAELRLRATTQAQLQGAHAAEDEAGNGVAASAAISAGANAAPAKATAKTAAPKKAGGKASTNTTVAAPSPALAKAAIAKEPVSKKAASKKAGPKKLASKKAVSKKPASKKAGSKKAVSKKAASKKAGSKKAGSKKAASKKAGSKKAATKKRAIKK